MNKFLVQKINDAATTPTKNTDLDAGYDLYTSESGTVPARGSKIFKTGICVGLPYGDDFHTYGRIASRSGLAVKYNIEVGAGVVDSGYRGELMVLLRNHSDNEYYVQAGDKIAQMIIEVYKSAEVEVVENVKDIIGDSERNTDGFGSSGR